MATLGPTTRLRAVSAPTVSILAVTGPEHFRLPMFWRVLLVTQVGTPPQAWPEAAF